MTEREFCYWLQGFFEISDKDACNVNGAQSALTPEQVAIIRDHLKLVFTKVTPNRPSPPYDHAKAYRDMVEGVRGNFPSGPGALSFC